jgi:transposase-like protein
MLPSRAEQRSGGFRKHAEWPKAVAEIPDDLEVLLAFYDYPAEHWIHLRTTPGCPRPSRRDIRKRPTRRTPDETESGGDLQVA